MSFTDIVGKVYLYPIYSYYKHLGGECSKEDFYNYLDSASFDKFLLEAQG
jgi:hypothetical protein